MHELLAASGFVDPETVPANDTRLLEEAVAKSKTARDILLTVLSRTARDCKDHLESLETKKQCIRSRQALLASNNVARAAEHACHALVASCGATTIHSRGSEADVQREIDAQRAALDKAREASEDITGQAGALLAELERRWKRSMYADKEEEARWIKDCAEWWARSCGQGALLWHTTIDAMVKTIAADSPRLADGFSDGPRTQAETDRSDEEVLSR
jgi:hypothetical protein